MEFAIPEVSTFLNLEAFGSVRSDRRPYASKKIHLVTPYSINSGAMYWVPIAYLIKVLFFCKCMVKYIPELSILHYLLVPKYRNMWLRWTLQFCSLHGVKFLRFYKCSESVFCISGNTTHFFLKAWHIGNVNFEFKYLRWTPWMQITSVRELHFLIIAHQSWYSFH